MDIERIITALQRVDNVYIRRKTGIWNKDWIIMNNHAKRTANKKKSQKESANVCRTDIQDQ